MHGKKKNDSQFFFRTKPPIKTVLKVTKLKNLQKKLIFVKNFWLQILFKNLHMEPTGFVCKNWSNRCQNIKNPLDIQKCPPFRSYTVSLFFLFFSMQWNFFGILFCFVFNHCNRLFLSSLLKRYTVKFLYMERKGK